VLSRVRTFVALGGIGVALALTAGQAPAVAGTLPFVDQYVVGGVGFCTSTGHEFYSGSIYAKPFAPLAVATSKAPEDYSRPGRKAVLYAFQPRQYLDPSFWEGNPLSADSSYSNANVPMVQSTVIDPSLAVFLAEFPPTWNGYVEIRIFDGHIGAGYDTSTYPATIIQVRGTTWTALNAPKVNCDAGHAVSAESLLDAKEFRYYERLQAKQKVIDTVHGPVSVVPPGKAPSQVTVTPTPSSSKSSTSPEAKPGAATDTETPRVEKVRPVTSLYSTHTSSISAARLAEIAIGIAAVLALIASYVVSRRRKARAGTP
jgi:hypothetical protein